MELSTFLRRLGENIRKARWLKHLTQEEVAERAGITYRHYQAIERGQVNVSVRTLLDLAQFFGRPVSELIDVDSRPVGRERLRDLKASPPKRGRKARVRSPRVRRT